MQQIRFLIVRQGQIYPGQRLYNLRKMTLISRYKKNKSGLQLFCATITKYKETTY